MAMNNWGGIREHMSKKPRNAYEKKKNHHLFLSKKNTHTEQPKPRNWKGQWWGKKDLFFLFLYLIVSVGILIWGFKNF